MQNNVLLILYINIYFLLTGRLYSDVDYVDERHRHRFEVHHLCSVSLALHWDCNVHQNDHVTTVKSYSYEDFCIMNNWLILEVLSFFAVLLLTFCGFGKNRHSKM